MEVLEFRRCYKEMCDHYCGNGCRGCEAIDIDCELNTNEIEKLVEIVERWAKANPEEAADATKPKQDETCVKTMQDDLNGAIYNSIIFNRERIENLEDNFVTLRHNMAGLDAKISALRERVDNVPTPKPKRTRMDVLLDVFPQAVMDGDVPALCPRSIVNGISLQYCAKATCSDCKREYWLAEMDE